MEFVKNRVKEIWDNQSFVSSQMDGVEYPLVALEKVTASFSHFIIDHWVPAQAILIDLHNSTCPSCQRADEMAKNWCSAPKPNQSGQATPYPVPPPNPRQGEAPPIISPIPSLISDSSSSSNLPFFFVGARQRLQDQSVLFVYIDKQQAHCHSSLVAMKGKLEAMKTFWKLQKDLGLDVALESFWKVLLASMANMYHDAVGCPNCCFHGNWEFCRYSRYHPQHTLHVCPESRVCFCLNPKYPYDHFD